MLLTDGGHLRCMRNTQNLGCFRQGPKQSTDTVGNRASDPNVGFIKNQTWEMAVLAATA